MTEITVAELVREVDVTPGLERAIRTMAATGATQINPPIMGGLVRLDLFNTGKTRGARLAREYVKVLDEYRAGSA